ncbi:Aminopeptidase [Arachis hypogaea]|nr:Aminopeptidase [Arachis hypogaea]
MLEDDVEKVVIVVDVEAEEATVGGPKVVEGVEAMEEAVLELHSRHGKSSTGINFKTRERNRPMIACALVQRCRMQLEQHSFSKHQLCTMPHSLSPVLQLPVPTDSENNQERRSFIVLNAAELTVAAGSVSFTHRDSSKVIKPSRVELFESDEILVLEFAEAVPIGLGVLAIQFEGILNDRMKGFYRSTYEHNDEKKNMAVTQFEPADARRCFPCWDEPACKATFKITLDVPSELVALSNMPVVEEKVDGSLKQFHIRNLQSCLHIWLLLLLVYLIMWKIIHPMGSKFEYIVKLARQTKGNLHYMLLRELWNYTRSAKHATVFKNLCCCVLHAKHGHPARIMFRMGNISHSAAVNKQRVATVVGHELAHQWFGNLVTMEWWTDLWLNEGFATWVSYLATDSLFPDWKIWSQFVNESTEGLRLDGLAESHPIEVEVNHAGEIDEIFDSISYRKGASVIRMLQSYLGAERFQRSLASYIKKQAYSNAKTVDLWNALEEGSGEPKGYPVVSVKVNDQKLEFNQSQFLSSGANGEGHWVVPVTLCFGSYDVRKNFLLQAKSEALDIKELVGSQIAGDQVANSWIEVNVDQTGFYRVKYDEPLVARLRYAIDKQLLSTADRHGILDDLFALCMARQESLTSLINLMGAYRGEVEYIVLSSLISVSYKVRRIAADAVPDLVDYFKQFFINLFQYTAERLGWEPKPGESHLDAMLRGEILTALAQFGHDLTLEEANKRFQEFLNDRNTPLCSPDIRKATYVAVMQQASKTNRSGSLSDTPDPDLVLEVLNFMLSPEVRSQDVIMGLPTSPEGRDVAWEWLKENWERILKTYGSGFLITRFVSAVVSPFASVEKAKEVEEFFVSHGTQSIARTLKQSLERVNINANWVQSVKNENNLLDAVKELAYRKY